jgi:N utilization substance protein A
MNNEFILALKQIEKERNIPLEMLLEALEDALAAAHKRNFGPNQNVVINIDRVTGEIRVLASKLVVKSVTNPVGEISLKEARKINAEVETGDEIMVEVMSPDFGRIAAQTAKQVIVQRIREAERDILFSEYARREGDIVSGIVQRFDQKNCIVDIGKAEGIVPPSEQVPTERLKHGDRIKAYVLEVRKSARGPQVVLSRNNPNLLKRLFEIEVPEIRQGIILIKGVVREAGSRAKIAVKSLDSTIDPVGACVGPKGSRVQTIVDELKGEKVDIIPWSEDPAIFIANSLSPARVQTVYIDDREKSAIVVVPDNQLSLAIGRDGQNARLGVRLTGWKIDIKNETQAKVAAREAAERAAKEEVQRKQREAEEREARLAAETAAREAAERAAFEEAERALQKAFSEEEPVEEVAAQEAPEYVEVDYTEISPEYLPPEKAALLEILSEHPEGGLPEGYEYEYVEYVVPEEGAEALPVHVPEDTGKKKRVEDIEERAPKKKKAVKEKRRKIEDYDEEYEEV